MKIRDFIKQEIDTDVVDTEYDEYYHAFAGPVVLTPFGHDVYSYVLDLDIEYDEEYSIAIINLTGYDGAKCAMLHEEARDFFATLAGYCAESWYNSVVDYDKTYEIWKE